MDVTVCVEYHIMVGKLAYQMVYHPYMIMCTFLF